MLEDIISNGAIVFLGGLVLFMLKSIYDNKGNNLERRESDQSMVGVYSELLHIMNTVTKIDGGVDELIRANSDPDSKVSTVKLREEVRELRKELTQEVESIRRALDQAKSELQRDMR